MNRRSRRLGLGHIWKFANERESRDIFGFPEKSGMDVIIKYVDADTARLRPRIKEVGGMVEVLQWIDAAAHRQMKERKARRRREHLQSVWAPSGLAAPS